MYHGIAKTAGGIIIALIVTIKNASLPFQRMRANAYAASALQVVSPRAERKDARNVFQRYLKNGNTCITSEKLLRFIGIGKNSGGET